MALISEGNLGVLTEYLGDSYEVLHDGLGTDIHDRGKSRSYLNQAKVFVRGGSDSDGVDISIDPLSCLVALDSGSTVKVEVGGRYYINGVLYTLGLDSDYTFNLTPGGEGVAIGAGEAYNATIYIDSEGDLGAEKGPKYFEADTGLFPFPESPNNTIELANIIVTEGTGAAEVDSGNIIDTRYFNGFLGLEDDDQMLMFSSILQDETSLISSSLNFSSYFRRSVNAIRSHATSFSGGRTFEKYYQYRDFEFEKCFRLLHYALRSIELSQRMGFLTYNDGLGDVTTSSMQGGRFLSAPAQFEIYVPRYAADGTTTYDAIPDPVLATDIEVYLVKNTYTTLSDTISDSDTGVINFGSTSSFSDDGYILVGKEILAYSDKASSTSLTITDRGEGTSAASSHFAGVKVYEVELQTVNIAAEADMDDYDDSTAVGTSSDVYIECAGFGTITGGESGLLYGVRNVVS